jgi:hypothetical protein
MTAATFDQEVRVRHAAGASPKEIARALGVSPSAVVPIVRRTASQRTEEAPRSPSEVYRCWVSPGWSEGLTIEGHPDWPENPTARGMGLASAAVARPHRHGKVSVFGYLVDTHCLGVKDALGPRVMREQELPGFLSMYFGAYEQPPLSAPIELARHLVLGAVEYARSLGFEPHADFERARDHLGTLSEPCAIRFGKDGMPLYVQGPHDDPDRIMSTLERSKGRGNFGFLVGGP